MTIINKLSIIDCMLMLNNPQRFRRRWKIICRDKSSSQIPLNHQALLQWYTLLLLQVAYTRAQCKYSWSASLQRTFIASAAAAGDVSVDLLIPLT